ncbi:MAG: hypothetical protein GF313_11270 [Caldithrix sp.]|nr:hypothetical protein [Caldithrix sp.]
MLYIGQTHNLSDRLNRHNQNRNKYTAGKGPWKLLYYQSFATRREAIGLEAYLKGFKNKTYLLQWIAEKGDLEHPDSNREGY